MTLRPQGLHPHAAGPLGLPERGFNVSLWLPRVLLVLFIALIMLGVTDNLWAQQENPYKFPFVDPNNNRAQMLANAFSVQMGLFMGGVGGIPALTMLGMVAALVGGITLVFRRDFSPAIISTWMLVVAIVIFVPLNSSLLFAPIKVAPPTTITNVTTDGATLSQKNLFNGIPCANGDEAWKGCGFTPQLVAVHVTSVVQVILSDLFRSRGWRGLIERQAADSMLRTRPELKLSEAWLHQSNLFVEQCRGRTSLGDMLAGINSGRSSQPTATTSPATTEQVVPYRFGELWDRWRQEFSTNQSHNKIPFIALLPATAAEAQQYGWGESSNSYYRTYELALTSVYQGLNPGSLTIVKFEPNSAANEISVADALEKLKEQWFLRADTETSLLGSRTSKDIAIEPGFFMAPLNESSQLDSGGAAARLRYISNIGPTDTMWDKATDFTTSVGNTVTNWWSFWSNPANHWATFKFIDDRVTGRNRQSATYTEPWKIFIQEWANIKNMPVIYGEPQRNQASRQGSGDRPGITFKPLARQSCNDLGKDLLSEAIRSLGNSNEGGAQRDNYLAPYYGMLQGTNKNIPDRITIDDIISGVKAADLQRDRPNRYAFIKMLADDADNTLFTSGARGQRPEIKQAALVNRFVRLSQDVTGQAFQNINRTAAENAAQDGRRIDNRLVGSETFTEIAGNVSFFVGEWLIRGYSWLMGPLAFATIMFLNVMIDLCLYAVIVLTPLLLLAGVLQPRKALGYLIIVTVVVFVLKFVPISLIILNNIAGMVYELLPSALGMSASLAQSMMMIGLATIYMSLIGFTLYLIFKSGDPTSTIGAMANLDSAAKQAAEAGVKYGLAAAGLVASLGLGMAFAAAKGTSMMMAAKRELKKVPGVGDLMDRNEAANKEREKQQQAAVEERNNKYGEFVDDGKSIGRGPQNSGPGDVNAPYYDPMRTEAAERLENLSNDERDSITNHLKEVGSDKGVLLGNTSDGREIVARLNGAGDIVATIEPPLEDPMPYVPKAVTGTPAPDGTDNAASATDDGTETGTESAAANAEAAATIAAAQNAQANTVIVAAGAQAAPLPVDVVKGKLESVEKLPEVKMAEMSKPETLTTEQRVEAIDKQRAAERTAQEDDKLKIIRDSMDAETDPEKKELLGQYQAAILAGDTDKANKIDQELRDKDLTEDERKAGLHAKTFTELQLKRNEDIKNYENQIQEWRSQVQSQLKMYDGKDDKSLTHHERNHKKTLLSAMDLLNKSDGIAFNMADRFKALSEGKDALRRATLQADIMNMPGAGTVALSALYGWGAGLFSGGGSIPVIGNVLREVGNEYLQAPERAKAWNAAGGAYKWWKAQTKASQMGYYSKEVAPLAAAAQYDAMSSMGMFEGNIRLAQQAATEAVARSRSDYEALNMRLRNVETFDKDLNVTVEPRKFLNANDLYGLGLENSITRINTVYQEALQGRQGTIDVVQAKYNKDGTFAGEEKVTIRKTAEISSEISQRMIAKGFGGAFEATMLKYYGLSEKRDRGGEYDNVRDAESAKAQIEVARLDAEANYLVGGHINMVQGKADFFGYRGKYQAYSELRNQSNTMVHEYIKANAAALNVPLNLIPQINQTQYNTAVKAATEAIGKINLPLNGVFEEAQTTGYANIKLKSQIAGANLKALEDDNFGRVMKAWGAATEASASKLSKLAQRQISLEFDGKRQALPKMTDKISELFLAKFGSIENGNKALQVLTKTLENMNPDQQAKAFEVIQNNITTKDAKGKEITIGRRAEMRLSDSFAETLGKNLERELGYSLDKIFVDAGKKMIAEVQVHKDSNENYER